MPARIHRATRPRRPPTAGRRPPATDLFPDSSPGRSPRLCRALQPRQPIAPQPRNAPNLWLWQRDGSSHQPVATTGFRRNPGPGFAVTERLM